MWLLLLITIANASLSMKGFLVRYRLDVGGVPINVLDVLTFLGLLLLPLRRHKMFVTNRFHPLMRTALVLFALMTLCGLIEALLNGCPIYVVGEDARNLLALPAAAILGYYYIVNIGSPMWYGWVQVVGGFCAATLILTFFYTRPADVATYSDINLYRTVDYVAAYAGIAAALLAYSIASGIRLLPTAAALALAGFCLVGQFATLARSDWLATLAAIVMAGAILPRGKRLVSAVRFALASAILCASIAMALYLASHLSGQDFFAKMGRRVGTLLPSDRSGEAPKAWVTRVGGSLEELRLWLHNPLTGNGLAIQALDAPSVSESVRSGFYHDTWTSTLAQTGLLGFAAMAAVVGGCIVVGRRVIRDEVDYSFMLVGALAVATGSFFAVEGLTSYSFNQQRWAIVLGMTFGAVLRVRAMQLTFIKSRSERLTQPNTDDASVATEAELAVGQAHMWSSTDVANA